MQMNRRLQSLTDAIGTTRIDTALPLRAQCRRLVERLDCRRNGTNPWPLPSLAGWSAKTDSVVSERGIGCGSVGGLGRRSKRSC